MACLHVRLHVELDAQRHLGTDMVSDLQLPVSVTMLSPLPEKHIYSAKTKSINCSLKSDQLLLYDIARQYHSVSSRT